MLNLQFRSQSTVRELGGGKENGDAVKFCVSTYQTLVSIGAEEVNQNISIPRCLRGNNIPIREAFADSNTMGMTASHVVARLDL